MIKMAQLEDIRKMYFMEGLSIREINRRTGIHRDTISKYISTEEPTPPKYKLTKERNHPVLGPYIPLIKQIIEDDKTRPRKQRHTGTKIFETLKKEGFLGGYNTVMDYLRKEYRKQREAFLPLEFELGAYAEVDWTEAYFYLKGKETKAHLFVMKLRGSGGFYVRAYPFEKQEAFFDGHIKCFEFMNGVPYKIAYDNLKTAVKKILEGGNREEQEQFIALRSQYIPGQGTFTKAPKNETSSRVISLPEIVISLLKEYKVWWNEQKLSCGDQWDKTSDRIFVQWNGKPIHPSTPTKWFKSFRERNNLPVLKFHGLRHTNASLLISNNVDVQTVAKRLGHSKATTTTSIYSHFLRKPDREAAEKLDNMFGKKKQIRTAQKQA